MFATILAAMTNVTTVIGMVRAVLPDVINLVEDVHKAMPASPTADKVAHVEDVLKTALADVSALPTSPLEVLPALLGIAARHFDILSAAPAPATQSVLFGVNATGGV